MPTSRISQAERLHDHGALINSFEQVARGSNGLSIAGARRVALSRDGKASIALANFKAPDAAVAPCVEGVCQAKDPCQSQHILPSAYT